MSAFPWLEGVPTVNMAGTAVPLQFSDPVAEYAAGRQAAVVVPRVQTGRVRASDRDRLDLLHRLSTNDLTGMVEGEARLTVLTTPIARIVDAVWVLNCGATALYLTGSGRAQTVRRWLAGYTFYNDRVKFEDVSAQLGQVLVSGPEAAVVMEAWHPGSAALAPDHFSAADDILVLRGRPLGGDGFQILAPNDRWPALWTQLLSAGARPAGETAYQWLRIAAGQPEAEHELTEDYIPLEANLWSAVSFRKGCYTGQEIIARMESRGKLARRLMGLRLAAAVAAGTPVHMGDTEAGRVTSVAELPDLGPVALAYLKTSLLTQEAWVNVAGTPGQVVELPFAG